MREYARVYHTSIKDLRAQPLLEFLRDYGEASEDAREEEREFRKKQEREMRKARSRSPHVKKAKRPRKRR